MSRWAVLIHAGIWGHVGGVWVGVWERKLQMGSWHTPGRCVCVYVCVLGDGFCLCDQSISCFCTWAFLRSVSQVFYPAPLTWQQTPWWGNMVQHQGQQSSQGQGKRSLSNPIRQLHIYTGHCHSKDRMPMEQRSPDDVWGPCFDYPFPLLEIGGALVGMGWRMQLMHGGI